MLSTVCSLCLFKTTCLSIFEGEKGSLAFRDLFLMTDLNGCLEKMNKITRLVKNRQESLRMFNDYQKQDALGDDIFKPKVLSTPANTRWSSNANCWARFTELIDPIVHTLDKLDLSNDEVDKLVREELKKSLK